MDPAKVDIDGVKYNIDQAEIDIDWAGNKCDRAKVASDPIIFPYTIDSNDELSIAPKHRIESNPNKSIPTTNHQCPSKSKHC